MDEEIGSVTRFHGDVDDILPHIMGFGEGEEVVVVLKLSCVHIVIVNNVRHLYTEWEENPNQMILKSKSSTTFLPLTSTSLQASDFIQDSENETTDTVNRDGVTHADSGFLESSLSGGSGLDDDDTSHSSYVKCKSRGVTRTKYSPAQLKTIQARVKDSLKNQGVFLYDPFTGAGKEGLSIHRGV